MKFFICAIIKDEHLYLKEWIDWHLSIGFDKIFLYEDFSSLSHKYITDEYKEVELHSMDEVPNCKEGQIRRQILTYNHFIKTHKSGWCLFIDIDEFFILDEGITLKTLISKFRRKYGIEVMWKCYGANSHINSPECSTYDAYHDDYKENWQPYWKFKSFVNLYKAYKLEENFINCHYHNNVVTTEKEEGSFKQSINNLSYNLCHIDHYITKSWEDYVIKLKRGNITYGIRDIDYFFNVNTDMQPLKDELTKDLDFSEFLTL